MCDCKISVSYTHLDVYKRQIVVTSGSGKSTLLSLLAVLEHPTSGKIFIKKKPTYKMNEKELVDFRLQHIGFVFQSFNLMPTMSAAENLSLIHI